MMCAPHNVHYFWEELIIQILFFFKAICKCLCNCLTILLGIIINSKMMFKFQIDRIVGV